jgi:hypothetical protein
MRMSEPVARPTWRINRMNNSPLLPIVSLILAGLLATAVAVTAGPGGAVPLSELQLGGLAGTLTLAVFGVQGLLSVGLEGRQLRPGTSPPHLTNPLSAAIVLVSLFLFADALLLGYGIVVGWGTVALGVGAGAGSVFLAALLVFYKEAFLGDAAHFDDREDGVPW